MPDFSDSSVIFLPENQRVLALEEPAYPRFDEFLGTANAQLLDILQRGQDQFTYIWGESGAGKSHILKAWVGQARQAGKTAVYVDAENCQLDESAGEAEFVAVDQVEKLNRHEQEVLFNIFNRFRNSGTGCLLLSATEPPLRLNMREDLRTRMGFCLVYEVQPLSDEEKIAALIRIAAVRQIPVDPKIFRYLLEHWRRDMDSLLRMLDDLGGYSLIMGKAVTLPMLRRLMQADEE